MKSDVQLQSISLDEAKTRIDAGWKFGHNGAGVTLEVWLQHPQTSAIYVNVAPSYFHELAEYYREHKAPAPKPTGPAPIDHILTPDSKALHSYGFQPETQTFEVRYKSNPSVTYRYAGVTAEMYADLRAAESAGSWVSKTFPRNQTAYPMTKVDAAEPIGTEGFQQTLDAIADPTEEAAHAMIDALEARKEVA